MSETRFETRASLAADLRRIGLSAGDAVMVHAAIGRIGPVLGGPDSWIGALEDVAGTTGTILAYCDWDAGYETLLDGEGRVPAAWRDHVPAFDPERSRAARDNGILPEFLRTRPGARRSGNPGASVVALGAGAGWFTEDHPLDWGYGEGSPFAKLVEAEGRILLVGAPLDTITLLHHAEHCARLNGKRVKRCEVPFAEANGTVWRVIEEFETGTPVVPGMAEDAFASIVEAFLASDGGRPGMIGAAQSVLIEAAPLIALAIEWLEERFG